MIKDTETDPIRIVTRIKNNRLLQCREEMGMTVKQFIAHVGISIATYYGTVSLRHYPSIKVAKQIAQATGYDVEYLFPDYLKLVSRTIAVRTISEPHMIALTEAKQLNLITDGGIEATEREILTEEEHQALYNVLRTLTPRQSKIIKMRYGFLGGKEYTLDEIAKRFSVTRECIRQIEQSVLKKLRKGSRKLMLEEQLGSKLLSELIPKGEDMSSKWRHNVCTSCYSINFPDQEPIRFLNDTEQICCYCGTPTTDGIYVREDPTLLRCQGNHGRNENESQRESGS